MCRMLLKDFLINYNFRKYSSDEKVFDTSDVRIYLSETNFDDWIQFGMYDFDSIKNKVLRIETALNNKILERSVSTYYYDVDDEVFCIVLLSKNRGDIKK